MDSIIFLEYIKNFLFPSDIYCAACGNLINGTRPYALCDDCISEIDWYVTGVRTCKVCGKALAPQRSGSVCADCREWGRSFDAGISCCAYSGKARDMVRTMKYKDSAWISKKIADVMYDRWIQQADTHTNPTCVVPVPMAQSKKNLRGYDQAALIASRLARLMGGLYRGNVLVRARNTAVMSGLGATNRRINISGAFELSPYAQRLVANGDLSLGDVLLIDDVFTTGSTADACAAVLKENGARSVTLFTFASGADVSPANPDTNL